MRESVGPMEFICGRSVESAAVGVWRAAKRSLLDLVAVAAAGRMTEASKIAHDIALEQWPAGTKSATLLFDGRRAGVGGVAFAGAQTIDSMDAHDGFKPAKGHAGVSVLPALLAVLEAENDRLNAREFLETLVIGYEISCRVAIAQHGTCADYHASGSWNALGAAAVASRVLGLDASTIREALGIAEYFGPRSQMMRVIDHPTMLKDSSSWGCMVGVLAAYLAAHDYTGAPPITLEGEEVREVWSDLGSRWLIEEQYFKLWPVCRWAQPAVQAALNMVACKGVRPEEIRQVTIHTFYEACRLLVGNPSTTDEAQYDIAFPTACAFVRGEVGVNEIVGEGLQDPRIRSLAEKIRVEESEEFSAAFPGRRFARLVVELERGESFEGEITEAPGDPEMPLTDEQLVEKFQALVVPVLGEKTAGSILEAIGEIDHPDFDLKSLLAILRRPQESFV
jgi:2-methylcitrate dehydratase PrpD